MFFRFLRQLFSNRRRIMHFSTIQVDYTLVEVKSFVGNGVEDNLSGIPGGMLVAFISDGGVPPRARVARGNPLPFWT